MLTLTETANCTVRAKIKISAFRSEATIRWKLSRRKAIKRDSKIVPAAAVSVGCLRRLARERLLAWTPRESLDRIRPAQVGCGLFFAAEIPVLRLRRRVLPMREQLPRGVGDGHTPTGRPAGVVGFNRAFFQQRGIQVTRPRPARATYRLAPAARNLAGHPGSTVLMRRGVPVAQRSMAGGTQDAVHRGSDTCIDLRDAEFAPSGMNSMSGCPLRAVPTATTGISDVAMPRRARPLTPPVKRFSVTDRTLRKMAASRAWARQVSRRWQASKPAG
jgi:hypothetical protein